MSTQNYFAAVVAIVRADVSGQLQTAFNAGLSAWAKNPSIGTLVAQLDLFLGEAAVVISQIPGEAGAALASQLATAQAASAAVPVPTPQAA